MSEKNPPPPAIGAKFLGPFLGKKRGVYHVRAIVDVEKSEEYGYLYQVVFCFWNPRKGWRYLVESAHALGLYTPKK